MMIQVTMPAPAPQSAPSARPGPSRRKRVLFAFIAVLLPIIGLACLEGITRLAGYGGYAPTFTVAGQSPHGAVVITDKSGPATFFYVNRDRPGSIDENAFLSPKPPDTVRVILSGESAMKGFPEPRGFSSGVILEQMLQDFWPNKHVEVINIGTTAIASFPMLEILTEGLNYEPDLVVLYGGNNEFFGAYGVASLNRAGRSPAAMRFQRAARSLGLVQWITSLFDRPKSREGKTLMEVMIGQSFIPRNDSLRAAAASSVHDNTAEMIRRCRARRVPVIVCSLPSNERDLAPLGLPDLDDLSDDDRARVQALVDEGVARAEADPAAAIELLEAALKICPAHARAHFLLGKARFAVKDTSGAAADFQAAIDFDTMPWRAPGPVNDAVARAAAEQGATLCDLRNEFRAASPGGCIGWELMDDHVHPSLKGQALIARAIVNSMTALPGPLHVDPEALKRLPDDDAYLRRLGDNPYDRCAVAQTLRLLYTIPFFVQTNPQALQRFDAFVKQLRETMGSGAIAAFEEWKKPETHPGGQQRPISGMVARAFVKEGNFARAEPLFVVAIRCVPPYSDWNIEYTYFLLACREKMHGKLSPEDRRLADAAIERGQFLLKHGRGQSALVERHIGRLHQLRGEFAESIPFLKRAHNQLSNMDRVAVDMALIDAYLRTGDRASAKALADDGVAHAGQFSPLYVQMEQAISSTPSSGPATSP